MTTIATIRPALVERQNNLDSRAHATPKKDVYHPPVTPLKTRVQQPPPSPFTSSILSSPSSATTTSSSAPNSSKKRKTPQKKTKKQAQIPTLSNTNSNSNNNNNNKPSEDFAAVTNKKVFSKDYLFQYRTAGDQTFPTGTSPAELICQYNDAFEKREQAAKAAEIAGVANAPRPIDPSRANPVSAPTTPAHKDEEKKKKRNAHNSNTTVKSSKFKFEGDETIFSKPFANVKIPPRPVFHSDLPSVVSDKENVVDSNQCQPRSPASKRLPRNLQKLTTTSTLHQQTTTSTTIIWMILHCYRN
eukprot:TRINITY_DN1113_c0_g3_i1.p1 TRINITY_DN1113_c0_g3~~TRINITY_DN1113_c0_g3_i1.p1  ORF type:complete len:301 (-),score=116.71 TRINITY_DN1113_c0_g3_i1:674-1576(-)